MAYRTPAYPMAESPVTIMAASGDAGEAARRLVATRAMLNDALPAMVVSNPGLDLLLALFIAAEDGRVMTLGSLDSATSASSAVMLRWIKALADEGLVTRDAARCGLTAQGRAVVQRALHGVMAVWHLEPDVSEEVRSRQ